MKKLFWITICLALTACEEKGVDDHSRHSRRAHIDHHAEEARALINPTKQRRVADFESFLATGQLLQGVKDEHFYIVLQALLDGVFDPNTVLTAADIERIGRTNCTVSDEDKKIGERRFERTITMAPELMSMQDIRGLGLRDWLKNLKRDDLLKTLR
jgi:hypothetical protein